MVAINEKYIPRKASNSGPANPTVAWQGKQGYQFEQALGAAGLQFVCQRWYDPATRQFISPDPLGFPDATVPWGVESGQVSGGDVNLYRYTGNNPVNRNDPGGEQFGDNFGQMGGGFSFLGPLVPSAPLQNSLGVQSPHTVQRAIIAHMPTHTSAERLAKQEALRSLNEPIDVASSGRLFTALIGFPFVLAYEGGKISYYHAVTNTTVLATRHLEHGGSLTGAGTEAISYNVLSMLGIEQMLEGGTGATLVHPHRLSTPQRVVAVGLGALRVGTLAIPEIREFLPGLGGSARVDTAVLRSFRLEGFGHALSPAELQRADDLFTEYMRYRSQGFTPAQAKYLTEPYPGWGHHFVPRQLDWPLWYSESPLNIPKPRDISRGEFYELHYLVDLDFHGAKFPSRIGGVWRGETIGLQKYGMLNRLWYGSPRPLKFLIGGAVGGGVTGYWYFVGDQK